MTTNAVQSPGNGYSQAITQSTGKNEMDKDAFLLLLVTQFKYQDPLNPMEDKEFIAQLAQFSALEQQMNTNEQMKSLVTLQTDQKMLDAVGLIGKEVSARGYGVSVESGKASLIQYSVSEEMASGYVNIFDNNNNMVASVTLPAGSSGIHDFTWDGKRKNGSTVADGVYTVQISALDANGKPLLVDTSVTGKVTGVSKYQGDQVLSLSDGRVVSMLNVREVQDSSSAKPEEKPEQPEKPEKPEDPEKPEEKPDEKPVDPSNPDEGAGGEGNPDSGNDSSGNGGSGDGNTGDGNTGGSGSDGSGNGNTGDGTTDNAGSGGTDNSGTGGGTTGTGGTGSDASGTTGGFSFGGKPPAGLNPIKPVPRFGA